MTTTISDLPRDLAEEILSRIPLKFMRAVRLTCKKWDTLSKNRSFAKKHAAKEENSNSRMIVLLKDYKLYLMSVVNGNLYTEPKGKLTCLNDSEEVEISQIFHSDGLLLCILKDRLRLVVWNPYLGQTRWIEPRYCYRREHGLDMYRYALGYSDKSKLILRFIDDYFGYYPNREHFLWYEIYDLDTGLWKTLDFTSPHWRISLYHRGLSLKGNTYWIATERESTANNYIICFDFTRERFGPLLPLPCRVWDDEFMTLSCVREEKIAALFQYNEASNVEIWITTKIEAEEVLWSKFLKVNMHTVADFRFAFSYFGSFFVDEEKRLAMVYDKDNDETLRHSINIIGEDGYFREVDLGEDGYFKWDVYSKGGFKVLRENYCWSLLCPYVPSLVQIKQGGCKTEKQSSLERHRCDQNTSTLAAIHKRMKEQEF